MNLIEYKRPNDNRDMVFIESIIPGSYAEKSRLRVGDTICAVGIEKNMVRTEGLGLEETIDIINTFLQQESPISNYIILSIKRLVKRVPMTVTFINKNNDEATYEILAGSNLRNEMMKVNIAVYDTKTKRFDQPYITGDCGGEGLCGTCLVDCLGGSQYLNPKDSIEKLVTRGRPASWRLSCRTVIGANNKKGDIKFRILPQKQ